MQLGGDIIKTPWDDPLSFDPDWRFRVARYWARDIHGWSPDEPEMKNDAELSRLATYLAAVDEHAGADRDPIFRDYRWAHVWYHDRDEDSSRWFLEALLMSSAPFNIIVRDMSGQRIGESPFRLYERLFFNVRNDDGTPDLSCYRRARAARQAMVTRNENTPEQLVWKWLAATKGYQALVGKWGWFGAHGLPLDIQTQFILFESWFMAQGTLLSRIVRNQIANEDLVGVGNLVLGFSSLELNYFTTQRKFKSQDTEKDHLLRDLLESMAPTVVKAAAIVDGREVETRDIQSRLQSQMQLAHRGPAGLIEGKSAVDFDELIKEHVGANRLAGR